MDISKVTDKKARIFLQNFFRNRNINLELYKRIPEDRLDYHMVHTSTRISDSPRRSMAHQIYVTRKYIYGIKIGMLKFDGIIDKPLPRSEAKMSKKELIKELEKTGEELILLLKDSRMLRKKVKVKWHKKKVSTLETLLGLYDHEILHTGWNLALMDHLGIERFPELKQVWG